MRPWLRTSAIPVSRGPCQRQQDGDPAAHHGEAGDDIHRIAGQQLGRYRNHVGKWGPQRQAPHRFGIQLQRGDQAGEIEIGNEQQPLQGAGSLAPEADRGEGELDQEAQGEGELHGQDSQQKGGWRRQPEGGGIEQEEQGCQGDHEGQACGLLGDVGADIAPDGCQGLQQVARKTALEMVFLEGVDHPHQRELAHNEDGQKVPRQGDRIQSQRWEFSGGGVAVVTAGPTPEAEHDERQHARERP